MIRLKVKKQNKILTEKQQKYYNYYQVSFKLINMNFLQVKKYYFLMRAECQNKLGLLILFQEKLEQLQMKEENKQIYHESK